MNSNNSKKINLMIGTDPKGQGGIAAVEQTMLEQPLAKNWQIQFVASHKSATKIGLLLIFLAAFFRIFALRLTGVPGFAHIHLASRGSFSRKALLAKWASFLGFRILLHLHGAQFDQFYESECSPVKQQKVAKLFYLADLVVVLGDKWFHWVSHTFPAVKKLKIVYNPGPSVTLPRQLNSTPTLLFLGRLGERKGVHDLIEALPEVIKLVPDLKIILGGDGDLDRFRLQAESAGILSHVEFAGWIGSERKFQLLSSSTAFVLPSYNEGFPVGIIEAMACGIPIVATTVGGIPDAITHGQEGLLVPAGDISALSQALISVLINQTLAQQLSSQAKHKYEQNFSCDAIMPLWDQLYMEISNG
ncbi:glycosyltransferase family 4 protein [Rheinheimera sp. SA_1]|uniref:glycosyltransferase family 4 protein n=1 Tax=Rheinheimera sp. SA_1 TaxID=1827365 RepID=UPI000B1C875D|nr:glycosyltransferase family 4 protein [Rheinheimera sp. SA_1]